MTDEAGKEPHQVKSSRLMSGIDTMARTDLRRRRADALTHLIFGVLSQSIPHFSPRDCRWACDELQRRISSEGYEVLTDYDRSVMGLPPRGPDGWTREEIVAHDNRLLLAMMTPSVPPMVIMHGCPTCGNKRCPHAEDPRFECTDSNEPGQIGAIFR